MINTFSQSSWQLISSVQSGNENLHVEMGSRQPHGCLAGRMESVHVLKMHKDRRICVVCPEKRSLSADNYLWSEELMDISSEAASDSEEHKVLHTTHKLTPPGTWQPWSPNPSLQSGLEWSVEQYKEICQKKHIFLDNIRLSDEYTKNEQYCLQSDLTQVLVGRTRGQRSNFWSLFSKHSSGEIWKRPLCKSTGACQDQIAGLLLPPSASRCLSVPDSVQTSARDAPGTCGCSVEGGPGGLHAHNTAINNTFQLENNIRT